MKKYLSIFSVLFIFISISFGQNQPENSNQSLKVADSKSSGSEIRANFDAPTDVIFYDDFESYPDGDLDIGAWDLYDADSAPIGGIDGFTFPHSGEAIAWTVVDWTPSATIDAHSGVKTVAPMYNSNAAPNNDWLISPPIALAPGLTDASLSFWTYILTTNYGPENLDVYISTDPNAITPGDFTTLLQAYVINTATTWEERMINLDSYIGNSVRIALQYHSTDVFTVLVDDFSVFSSGGGTLTVAEAIEDLDNDFVPDRLGDTVTVQGVVFSPNYQTTNNSYYLSDGTAGTDVFMYSPPLYSWDMGDELNVTGVVTQYNGMSEIIPIDSTGWVLVSSGNPTPDPTVLTLAQFKANAELYEGSLVGFVGLSLVSGTWPASGSSSNLSFSDGIDTVVFRIDSDTDIDGSPQPTWPADIIGIGSQYDNSAPYSSGYQVFPRFFGTDFLPAGSLPVELTSFSASVNEGTVNLNWTTATEINNNGFEVQRTANNEFHTIGFVQGHGTTTNIQNYSFVDPNVIAGNYTYRLKQVDFNGTFEYSNTIEVEVIGVKEFTLGQNYPNPFNPSTTINFSLAVDSKVSLKIFDVLGQEVATLVNGQLAAGSQKVSFDASSLNSGVYFYRIDANGIDGQKFSSTKKMILTK